MNYNVRANLDVLLQRGLAQYASANRREVPLWERGIRLHRALDLLNPVFRKDTLAPDFRGLVAFNLSFVVQKLGQYMRAIQLCCTAAALNPEMAVKAVQHRVLIWEEIGDFSNAAEVVPGPAVFCLQL